MNFGNRVGICGLILAIAAIILQSAYGFQDYRFFIALAIVIFICLFVLFYKGKKSDKPIYTYTFNHSKALQATDYRDWAFMYCMKQGVVGYPQYFSRESTKHQPKKHDTWRVENLTQATQRADRLIQLGLLKSYKNEVGLTKNGEQFVAFQ